MKTYFRLLSIFEHYRKFERLSMLWVEGKENDWAPIDP